MRVSVYLVCCVVALVIAVRSEENTNYLGRYLEPVNVAPDQETVTYLLPKLTAKYRPNSEWSGVTDPRFYLLTEMESNDVENQVRRALWTVAMFYVLRLPATVFSLSALFFSMQHGKRTISVQMPIEILRQQYMRAQMRKIAETNRKLLNHLIFENSVQKKTI